MPNKKQQRSRSSSRTQSRTSKDTRKRTPKQKGAGNAARQRAASSRDANESGLPGGGKGRRDVVGGSKVYPASGGQAPADAELRDMAAWGQGERGAEGYSDSGGSELVMREGQLLGGLDVGPSGAPTTDLPGESHEAGAEQPRRPKPGRGRTPE